MEKFYNFNYLFGEAQSNEVEYKGEKIYAIDYYKLTGCHTLNFKLVKSNANAERVLLIYTSDFKGKLFNTNDKVVKKPRGIYGSLKIWGEDWKNEKTIQLKVLLEEGNLGIANGKVCEYENKTLIESGTWWYAMKKEQISPTITRYYCNDTDNETDFDDLIFDLEILD